MKNEQLLDGLNKLGFRSEIHYSDLLGVISELMGIPETEISLDWFDVYMDFMKQARQYKITGDGKNLLGLAESTYNFLLTKLCKET